MGYAITTRYVGPTNYRGSRVIATGPALTHDGRPVRATVSWDYGISNGTHLSESEANARAAAESVAAKLRDNGWNVALSERSATLPDESGYVFMLDYGTDRAEFVAPDLLAAIRYEIVAGNTDDALALIDLRAVPMG